MYMAQGAGVAEEPNYWGGGGGGLVSQVTPFSTLSRNGCGLRGDVRRGPIKDYMGVMGEMHF